MFSGCPGYALSIHLFKCHLCRWMERIPGGGPENDGLETRIMGAAAATLTSRALGVARARAQQVHGVSALSKVQLVLLVEGLVLDVVPELGVHQLVHLQVEQWKATILAQQGGRASCSPHRYPVCVTDPDGAAFTSRRADWGCQARSDAHPRDGALSAPSLAAAAARRRRVCGEARGLCSRGLQRTARCLARTAHDIFGLDWYSV